MPSNPDKEKTESAIEVLERCEYFFRAASEEIERSSGIFNTTSTDSYEFSGTIESQLQNQNGDSLLRRFSDAAHSCQSDTAAQGRRVFEEKEHCTNSSQLFAVGGELLLLLLKLFQQRSRQRE